MKVLEIIAENKIAKKLFFYYYIAMINTLVAQLGGSTNVLLLLAVLWSIPWKGVALWKSARLSHTKWFIALLIINTFGILEIVYIFFIAKKYQVVEIEDNKTIEK